MLKRIARNPLIDLLVHLKGNERACLWTEPLWGIPYNLYVPFVSVYMAALGMTAADIIGLLERQARCRRSSSSPRCSGRCCRAC